MSMTVRLGDQDEIKKCTLEGMLLKQAPFRNNLRLVYRQAGQFNLCHRPTNTAMAG